MTTSYIFRYAVVTGANKGIGIEICKQLASNGVKVVLTARDEKRGLEALDKLKACGLSELVVFHQLDVADSASVATFAEFIKTQFGKLDILINNAGISGIIADVDALMAAQSKIQEGAQINWSEIITETYELAQKCVHTNYYGTKVMVEATLPLLQHSDSPKIVNVSSSMGMLKNISNEWAVKVLSDAESLTEEKVDEIVTEFLKDFKDGSPATKGWPVFMSAYSVSKAAMSAYTRILAKKYPTIAINCVCPGFVKTDINFNTGKLSVEEGAESPVRLALLPKGGPSGLFYVRNEVSPF